MLTRFKDDFYLCFLNLKIVKKNLHSKCTHVLSSFYFKNDTECCNLISQILKGFLTDENDIIVIIWQ